MLLTLLNFKCLTVELGEGLKTQEFGRKGTSTHTLTLLAWRHMPCHTETILNTNSLATQACVTQTTINHTIGWPHRPVTQTIIHSHRYPGHRLSYRQLSPHHVAHKAA